MLRGCLVSQAMHMYSVLLCVALLLFRLIWNLRVSLEYRRAIEAKKQRGLFANSRSTVAWAWGLLHSSSP